MPISIYRQPIPAMYCWLALASLSYYQSEVRTLEVCTAAFVCVAQTDG
jgi:hypothetical protein